MFSDFSQWIGSILQNIAAALDAALIWLHQISDSLNPALFVPLFAVFVKPLLPLPDPIFVSTLDQIEAALSKLDVYLFLLSYFLNLPIFALAIGVFFGSELFLLTFRAWRMVRSFIT